MIPVQNIYYMLSYVFSGITSTKITKIWPQKIFIIPLNYVQPFLIRALAYS